MIDISIKRNKLDKLIFYFPVLFLLLSGCIYYLDDQTYWRLFGVLEYGLFEWVQAVSYFVAAYMGIKSYNNARNIQQTDRKIIRTLLILFSIACFVIGMEEISWGQHIINWATPEFIALSNLQNETNLHNHILIQGNNYHHKAFIVVGFLGGFGFILRNIFDNFRWSKILFVDINLCLYFFPVAIFYAYFDWINPLGIYIIGNHQELYETLLSFGFLLLSFSNYLQIKKLIELNKHSQ